MSEEGNERDFESEARAEGWAPKDEWRGDPNKWIDAKTFVENGEKILPIVHAKNRKLTEQVQTLSERVDQLLATNQRYAEFSEKAIERERQEKAQLLKDLKAAKAKAVKDGDDVAFSRAEAQIEQIEKSDTPQGQPSEEMLRQWNADYAKWKSDNEWYMSDPTLTALMDGFSDKVKREKPHLGGIKFLEECERLTREAMPDKFDNPKRGNATVESPSPRKSGGGGRTFADLPEDAKKAFAQFKRDIPGLTEKQYLANYEWDQ